MEGRKLTLTKSGEFLGTKCDFYVDEHDFIYMTREQLGRALQYENPDDAIRRMHNRRTKDGKRKERLDSFSTRLAATRLEGGREVTRETVFYTEKGIYEIARISEQPIADDFYDWVYDQLMIIRRTGGTVVQGRGKEFIDNYFPSFSEEAKLIMAKEMDRVIKEQEEEIKVLEPKAKNWDLYMDAKGNVTIAILAKALGIKGVGRNNLFKVLRQREVFRSNNEPYQRYINAGLFCVVVTEKNGRQFSQTLATGKGMEWIHTKMAKWGYIEEAI